MSPAADASASSPEPATKTEPPRLAMRSVSKAFPGVQALDRVDFTLRRGEIHALMGENGAGKSTLIKALTGVYHRDKGEILLDGEPIDPRSPFEAQRLGVSTVYQEVNLIPHLSVAENIALGRQPSRFGAIRWGRVNQRARELLRRLELSIDVTRALSSYSIAIQQMVAIGRALDVDARILVLDEPTSSLDEREVAQLFRVMRRLRDDGLGVLFITHFLGQVYQIADRITVLRNGRLVGEYEAAQLPRIELISKMIGRPLDEAEQLTTAHATKELASAGDSVLRARALGRRGSIAPVDIDLRSGEVTGLAGLLGSGRTELARLLFGVDRADHGRLEIDGEAHRWRSPRDAIRRRIGFCPEDRKVEGLAPALSVRENILLAIQARRGWSRPVSAARQRELAERYIKALRIATPHAEKPVGQLSGGNQQKVILARWLASEPRVLIVDEPTRGIDVGAKAEIERLIGELCRDGIAILFISSELEEVARDSHRVVVLRDRRKVGELSGEEIDVSAIMRRIAQHSDSDCGDSVKVREESD